MLDAAYAAGVRHFDAARSYGRAEEFLGQWLRSRSIEPGAVTISSKWGYTYTADWQVDADPPEVKDLSADTLRRQLAETREQLGEHLTLYQIHSATASSGVLEDPEVRALLAELRSRGVAVGFSATGTEQQDTILHAIEAGGFDTVQATFNLLERSAGDALQAAHEAGMGVIIKEALANGRLTARGGDRAADSRGAAARDDRRRARTRRRARAAVGRHGAQRRRHGRAARTATSGALEIEWNDALEERALRPRRAPRPYWTTRSALTWT